MKTSKNLMRAAVGLLVMVSVSALCASSALSQGSYTTLMATQPFTSEGPSGWSFGTANWISEGNGGYNGSYMLDFWDYYTGPITTPALDVSAYASNSDSVWVDFDFFWEYNYWCVDNTPLDIFQLKAGSDVLLEGTEATMYTYYNTSDDVGTTIETNSAYWQHYHVLIPVADRSSSLVIQFTGPRPEWGMQAGAVDNVSITGYTVPPTQLSLLPKSLNYGAVSSGFSLTLYDTAYCLGPAALKFNGWSITGSTNFTVVSGPELGSTINPGQYAVFGIQFSPTSSGNLTGVFHLVTNGKDSGTQVCQLNGTGAAASVAYSFPYNGAYPANSLFHHVARRIGESATQYFYVTSNGVAPLNFNSVYFTGLQANMYSIVHMPPNPLASGVTDSIGVRFSPYLEGRPDAQLIVSTNAINIPYDTVSMWGVGVLGHLVVTPSHGTGNTLAFDSVAIGDSVCQSITLHNTGSDTVKITKQIVTYGDYDYTFYLLTGSDLTLPPDASKIVNVCFKPIARGGRVASIRFYTSIPLTYPENRDTSQFLINVTGTGVPYGIMSFIGNPTDSALIDSTKCANATIKNMGLSELTVTSATITGAGAADFTISGVNMPFTLAPGASVPVTLCFKAATRGPEAVTLTVNGTTSGRLLTQSIPLLGVGLTACLDAAPSPITFGSTALPGKTIAKTGHDTTCVTVTNCGDVPVTYTAAFTPNTNGGYHVLGALITPVVAPNGTTTICIEFDADTIGLAGGSVVISASEKAAAPKTLALAGVGAGVVIAGSGDGGILGLNYCDTITVTINNTGNMDWTPGSSIGTTGANASDFTPIGTTNPATIPAGGSGTIKVIFCPTTNGLAETADLTFPNAAPTPLSGTVTLNGLGSSGVTQQTEKDGFTLGASYPNPTNGNADVIVTLPRASRVTMVLTNLTGAVVRSVYSGTLQNGDNVVSLDASTLPSGTYFYTLTSGDVRLTREMIVGR